MFKREKQLWIAALRSDDYKQTTGSLRRGNHFCCLGVLCDLYKREHDGARWEFYGEAPESAIPFRCTDNYLEGNTIGTLPPEVIAWAGTNRANPTVGSVEDHSDASNTLTWINDSGMNFSEIASLIEEHL